MFTIPDALRGRRTGQQLGAGAEQAQGGLVHAQVELGPEDLVEARLGADLAAGEQPRDGLIGVERVGLGVLPAAGDGVAELRGKIESGVWGSGVSSITVTSIPFFVSRSTKSSNSFNAFC